MSRGTVVSKEHVMRILKKWAKSNKVDMAVFDAARIHAYRYLPTKQIVITITFYTNPVWLGREVYIFKVTGSRVCAPQGLLEDIVKSDRKAVQTGLWMYMWEVYKRWKN